MNILDIAKAVDENASHEIIGIRPGEKLHEQMIGLEDAMYTFEYNDYYKILPAINDWFMDEGRIKNGTPVKDDFEYTSNNNSSWMTQSDLQEWIADNFSSIGSI